MNKVFKVIWNSTLNRLIVVSELTKSCKKLKSSTGEHSTISKSVKQFILIATGALAAFSAQSATDTNTSLAKVKVETYNKDAVATGKGSIAIGDGATAGNKERNIAIGSGANISDKAFESIAIGGASNTNKWTKPTSVYGTQSIAIGGNTIAQGNSSIAIGNDDLDEANKFKYQGTDEFIDYTYDPKTGKVTNKTPWKLQDQSLQSIFTKMTGKEIKWHVETKSGGEASVAIGVQAVSNGHFGTALGSASKATGFGSVAFGAGAEATLLNSVALGAASKTDKEGQLQPGKTIFGTNYVWQGGSSIDKGDVVSIGTKGFERQLINLAPGEVSATSTDAVNGSQLYSVLNTLEKMRYLSVNSSKTGNKNNDGAKGNDSVAIGPNTTATNYAVAMGNQANAGGDGSIALGSENKAEARDGITIGRFASTNGAGNSQSIAIGGGNYDGAGAKATGDQSIAIGGNTNARGNSSIVIGGDDVTRSSSVQTTYTDPTSGNEVNGTIEDAYSAITGRPFKMINGTTEFRTAETGESAVALGNRAVAGDVALALGTNAEAAKTNSIAIGTGAVANIDNAVAIGGGSTTDKQGTKQTSMTQNGITFNWAAGDKILKGDIVSFGSEGYERQLKNVAAGEVSQTSTDAINGSQLYAVAEIATTGWNITSEADGGTANSSTKENVKPKDLVKLKAGENMVIDQSTKDFKFSVSPTLTDITSISGAGTQMTFGADGITLNDKKITGMANGVADKDAVNVSQLNEVKNIANKGWNLTAQGDNSSNVAAGGSVDLKNTDNNIVISKTTADNNVTFDLAKNISLDKVTTGNSSLDTNGLKVGDVIVTSTAPTVNGTTVNNLNSAITQTAAQAFNPLKFGGDSGTAFDRKLGQQVNVKGGVTDASTLSDNNIGVVADNATNTLNVKLAKNVKVDSVTAGDTKISSDGLTFIDATGNKVANTPSVTKAGIDAGNQKVTNVADGVDTKDAVNKGQLDKATQNLTTLGFGLKAQDGKESKKALGNTIEVVGDDAQNISTEIDETDANNKKLKVKLSKDLNITTVTAGNTKLDSNGLTVGGVTVTNAPITVGGTTINNVNDAINKTAEQAFKDLTVTGNTNSDTGTNGTQQQLGSTLAIEGGLTDAAKTSTAKNVRTVVTDNKVEIQIAEKPEFKEVQLVDGNNAVNLTPTIDGLKVSKADGSDAKISGVADGTDDSDAVNVKQLNEIKNSQLTFAGDSGTDVKRKLGETVKIKGGETDANKLVDGNIGVIADGTDTLNVKLAKELKNLTSAQFVDGNNNTVINGSGITITPTNGGNAVNLTNNGLNNGGNKITNVANGTDATDAVNKGQLDTAVNDLTTKGFGLKAQDGQEVKKGLGETVEVVGADSNIKTKVENGKVQIELAKNLDLGDNGSVKMGDTTVNKDGLKVGDKVSVTKDGLNVGDDVKVTENGFKAGDVEINKDTGINAGNKVINNVADGNIAAGSKEAVNGGQLHEVKELAGRGWNVTTSAKAGSTGVANGSSVTNVAPGSTVTYTAGNNIMLTQNGTQITIETNQNLDAESATIDTIKSNTINVGGPDAQGAAGKDGVVTVQSADGKASVGINGKDGSITLTKDGKHTSLSLSDGPEGVEGSINDTKPRLDVNGEHVATLNDGMKFGANDGTTHAAKLNTQVNVKGHKDNSNWSKFDEGKNIMTQVNGDTITVAMAKELNVDSVTAGGTRISENGLTFVNNNGKQIENSPSVTAKGIDAGKNQVTNVAPGRVTKDSKDAVNGAQLHAALSDVGNKYNALAGQVNHLGKRVNAGVASALAASQLPQAFMPGKGMVSVAAGNYQGENAVAVGVSKVSDNSKYIIRLSGTSDSQGKVGVAVGAGMHF